MAANNNRLASDDFNRANVNPMVGNWTTPVSAGWVAWKIVSNAAAPTDPTANDSVSYYNAITWPADHYSKATVNSESSTLLNAGTGVVARCASNGDLYRLIVNISASNNWSLNKWISPTYTIVWDRTSAWTNGNSVELDAQGTTLRAYNNGVQVGADTTDSGLSSGSPGPGMSQTAAGETGVVDYWEGGNFAAASVENWQFGQPYQSPDRWKPVPY